MNFLLLCFRSFFFCIGELLGGIAYLLVNIRRHLTDFRQQCVIVQLIGVGLRFTELLLSGGQPFLALGDLSLIGSGVCLSHQRIGHIGGLLRQSFQVVDQLAFLRLKFGVGTFDLSLHLVVLFRGIVQRIFRLLQCVFRDIGQGVLHGWISLQLRF